MTNEKPNYYLASFSGGKDSTAMVLKIIDNKMPLDCILFCDTTVEFPQLYEHIDKVEKYIGFPITRIKSDKTFEYYLLDHPVNRKNLDKFISQYGEYKTEYSWADARSRWCTAALKRDVINNFLKEIKKEYNVIQYVGLAYDEQDRLTRKNNQQENHLHPLVDLKMTEEDCLKYCYEKGFTWSGLYEHYSRVSCWCCLLQKLDELRTLYNFFPDLWNKLKEWDNKTFRKFRPDYSVEELEIRFNLEKRFLEEGKSIKNKPFFTELKHLLGRDNE